MTNALGVYVGERAEELVDVQLDFEDRHGRLEFVKVPRGAVHGLRNKLEYQVQVYFIFLRCNQRCLYTHEIIELANPITVGIVECLELHDVRMSYDPHDLELSVLHRINITHI